MPYYAVLLSKNEEVYKSQPQNTFFHSLIKSFNKDEITVLIILSTARIPISLSSIKDLNLFTATNLLINKRIVHIEGEYCHLHDLIKNLSQNYFKNIDIEKQAINVLLTASEESEEIIIDLINKFIFCNKLGEAFSYFINYFNKLLNKGHDLELLDVINSLISSDQDFSKLIIKKIIILERIGEYQTIIDLIDLVDNVINLESDNYADWIYIKLRVLYFDCQFESVMDTVAHSIIDIEKFEIKIFLQILLLYGRCFYISGNQREAIIIYLYVFIKSLNTEKPIVVKALHRIAMIEEVMGFDLEALALFKKILSLHPKITKKRESYSLYRISKCYLKIGDYPNAIVSNEMSIKIKKEFNHQRGLVFSYKLNSKIQKKKGNFIEAKLWAYKAYNLAMQIGIKKEIMATGTNLLNLLIENKEINDELDKIIEEIIHLAVELKLPSRLKNIEDILIKLNANKYLDRITFLRNSEQIRIPTVSQYVIHKFEQQLPNKMKNKIELLINQKEAISPSIINGLF